jgi:O-antigen ligase
MIVFCVAVAYGFFERFNDFYNPLFEYQSSINPEAEMFGYGDESRAGLGRVHSIFANALDCSAYMGVVLVFFYYMSMRHRKIWNSPAVMKISFMAGMAFILLFSNSRGGMLYVGLSLLFILKLKNMLRLALFLPFLVLLFYDWLAPYAVTVLSIFNSDRADEAGGSSLAMRVLQFLATIEVWKDRALFGYGPFAVRYLQELRPDLPFFGFESIWLQLLIREGILGVIAHIYLLYSMMKLGVNKSKRYVVGSVIACIALTSATVGLSLSFFMSLLLVVYRLELLSDTQHTIKEMQP